MASPPVMLRWGVTALMVGALAAAGAAVAGAAPDVARPSEMLLAVYTEEEHRNRLAVQAQQVVGVKAVALVARTALRLVRSWDVGGRAVDEGAARLRLSAGRHAVRASVVLAIGWERGLSCCEPRRGGCTAWRHVRGSSTDWPRRQA